MSDATGHQQQKSPFSHRVLAAAQRSNTSSVFELTREVFRLHRGISLLCQKRNKELRKEETGLMGLEKAYIKSWMPCAAACPPADPFSHPLAARLTACMAENGRAGGQTGWFRPSSELSEWQMGHD